MNVPPLVGRLGEVAPGVRAAAAVGIALVAAYLPLRLIGLGSLPPFVDELVYANHAYALAHQGPFSLVWDGHGPSYFGAEYWVGAIIQPLVLSGRFLSAASGLATVVLLILIGSRLWDPWAGLAAGALYLLLPLAVTYDRLALVESYQAALMMACLYFSLVLASERRLNIQIVLGLLLMAAMTGTLLVKLSSTVVLPWVVIALLLGGATKATWQPRRLSLNGPAWLVAAAASAVSLLFFLKQYQNPEYRSNTLEGLHFPVLQIITDPLHTWVPRLGDFIVPTLVGYLTIPVLVLLVPAAATVLVRLVMAARRRRIEPELTGAVMILGVASAALAAPIFYVSVQYPRYLFTGIPPLLLLGGWLLTSALRRSASFSPLYLAPALAVVLSLAGLGYDVALISDPVTAPLPQADRTALITGWSAGYGLAELAGDVRSAQFCSPAPSLVALVGERPLWSYQMNQYMTVDRPASVGSQPVPELRDVSLTSPGTGKQLDVRTRLSVTAAVPILAVVEGGGQSQQVWLNANPGFRLRATYEGPGMHSYFVYCSD